MFGFAGNDIYSKKMLLKVFRNMEDLDYPLPGLRCCGAGIPSWGKGTFDNDFSLS